MITAALVLAIITFIVGVLLIVSGIMSFMNRGFLFNNAYIYASKEEREKMDKKPYYRQTSIVLLLLACVSVIQGFSFALQNYKLTLLEIPVWVAVLVYSIWSTIRINKKK